jgi:vacuolar-type H+-ATPase subunit I/STV1
LKTKIEKYLHRVSIVEDSKTLALLRSTIAWLDQARTTTTNSLIDNDSTLHSILQSMQTTIEQLQRNDSRFKSKSYTKTLRIVFESIIKSVVADKSINLKTTKQVREFTILIVDDVEREILKIMIIKNSMNKLQIKKIREIIRLNNDDLKIQTKSEKIKNSLQKKSQIIRRIIESITIRIRIYAIRVNEVKVEHIDTNNQFDVIKYLQKINASLHSNLIIKKMSWSSRIINDKKRYFTLHMKIIIVEMINRMLFEDLMKIFEIKKCERFIKNCILRQCFNCQKYEHIEKHCRIVVVCEKCVMKHHISECDSSIIEKYKMCEACENREHIAWSSKCRMRRKKKQKTEHVRQIRMRLLRRTVTRLSTHQVFEKSENEKQILENQNRNFKLCDAIFVQYTLTFRTKTCDFFFVRSS